MTYDAWQAARDAERRGQPAPRTPRALEAPREPAEPAEYVHPCPPARCPPRVRLARDPVATQRPWRLFPAVPWHRWSKTFDARASALAWLTKRQYRPAGGAGVLIPAWPGGNVAPDDGDCTEDDDYADTLG